MKMKKKWSWYTVFLSFKKFNFIIKEIETEEEFSYFVNQTSRLRLESCKESNRKFSLWKSRGIVRNNITREEKRLSEYLFK